MEALHNDLVRVILESLYRQSCEENLRVRYADACPAYKPYAGFVDVRDHLSQWNAVAAVCKEWNALSRDIAATANESTPVIEAEREVDVVAGDPRGVCFGIKWAGKKFTGDAYVALSERWEHGPVTTLVVGTPFRGDSNSWGGARVFQMPESLVHSCIMRMAVRRSYMDFLCVTARRRTLVDYSDLPAASV